jgi:FKBP-type peptidyl-prolyl cis-trans isomerase 2
MARFLPSDRAGVSNWVILISLVVIVAAALGAYYTFFVPRGGPAPLQAQPGDQLQVAYIGFFQDTGRVFDTSNASVARDNASWPKAVSFGWRGSWTPLSLTVSGNASSGTIKGFDLGVRGMSVGQTKNIVVPPELGYGPMDPSLVFVHHLLESVPVHATMNVSVFTSTYGEAPNSGSNVSDPIYRWPVQVSVANDIVTITNSPVPGQALNVYGHWPGTVLTIDDAANNGTGVISVQSHLNPSAVDVIGGNANGKAFYISAVDTAAGTYTLNFNREVVGRTLVFQVTLLQITRTV